MTTLSDLDSPDWPLAATTVGEDPLHATYTQSLHLSSSRQLRNFGYRWHEVDLPQLWLQLRANLANQDLIILSCEFNLNHK